MRGMRAKKHVSPNDRLTHAVFGQNKDINPEELFASEAVPVRTDDKGKLFVMTKLEFKNDSGVILPQCLNDSYIRAVHDSVLSLYLAGCTHFTAEQIDREMKGYDIYRNEADSKSKSLQNINGAINILRRSLIIIDASNEANARGYKFRETHFSDNLLHIRGLHSVLMNGRQVDAYEFLAEPVLYSYASQKGQVISCDIDMLKFPKKLSATRNNIILQRYLIERIEVMKNSHNNLGCVILYESIYEALNMQDSSRIEKKRIRDTVKKLLDNWQGIYFESYFEEPQKAGVPKRDIVINLFK